MPKLRSHGDPYRVLGVGRSAGSQQIKAAHRRLAKRYHPDGSTGDEPRFLAVQEAYQLLSDPQRRGDWDRRYGPGPIRADGARKKARRKGSARAPRPDAEPRPAQPQRAARPERDPRTRKRTWSAERVPWWEDFVPHSRTSTGSGPSTADAPGEEEPPRDNEAGEAPDGAARARSSRSRQNRANPAPSGREMDFDVFNRSSGAAWSMAARKHFRKGDADLPSRGAWRYRGTQVVTGAEARKVAAEETAADEAAKSAERQRRANDEASARRGSRSASDRDRTQS